VALVTDDNLTRSKILRAALHYVALHGSEKLSMSGVAESANLARGTVYRYFANSEELMEGMGAYVRAGFRAQIARSTAEADGPRMKIEKFVESRIDPETWEAVRRLREYQPAFTLIFLTDHMPDYVQAFRQAFAEDFRGQHFAISLDAFANIVARIFICGTLLNDNPALTRKLALALWSALTADSEVAAPAQV